jgi:hypothetical protein
MFDYLIASGLILVALIGWTLVQGHARNYAARHPEHGPAREEGTGCGKSCLCRGKQCIKKTN